MIDVSAIRQRVHIDFDRIFEEVVDQHGPLLRVLHGFFHVVAHGLGIVGDDHRPAAQHVGGAHQHRVADALRPFERSFDGGDHRARGLRDLQVFEQLAKPLTVFRQVDRFRRGADDFYAGCLQRQRKIERRLPAKLHDHADIGAGGGFVLVDGQHVFKRERLEVQPVTGVVVGRHRLRVAIDHDGFVIVFAQGEGGVTATVIELNALPDAVGAAAKNDDLAPGSWAALHLLLRKWSRDTAFRCRTRRRRCRPS